MATVNERLNAQAARLTDLERLNIDSRLKALEAKAHTHPDPVPTPTPTPTPTPPPTGNPSFLTRPIHAQIVVDGGSNVDISNYTIRGGGVANPSGMGLIVRNVNGRIYIHDMDIADVIGGIYLYQCTGTILFTNIRSRNVGDGTVGAGHSNHIQIAESKLAGSINHCEFKGGRTEDMISIWHSGGAGLGQELVFEDNVVVGLVSDTATARAWNSGSGTGTCVSDGAGSPNNGYVIVRRNSYLTPGQVGINLIDGPGLQVYENVLYGEQRPQSNNPMTTWEGTPKGVAHDNRHYWKNANGALISPWFGGGINPQIVATNNPQDPTIDPTKMVGTI